MKQIVGTLYVRNYGYHQGWGMSSDPTGVAPFGTMNEAAYFFHIRLDFAHPNDYDHLLWTMKTRKEGVF